MSRILEQVDGKMGFYLGLRFNAEELEHVRSRIETMWLETLNSNCPEEISKFRNIGITDYHTLSHLVNHGKIWTKHSRIFKSDFVAEIRNSSLFKSLESDLGDLIIAGEDGVEPEEIYWRLVRPNSSSDVGPLHADEWFWRVGNWHTPDGYRRLKIWISIFSERGKNGFKFVAGSHTKEWNFHAEEKNGTLKPVIQEDEIKLGTTFFEANPGDAIVFHDKLLHGGSIGGDKTRVSMEWTMFVRT